MPFSALSRRKSSRISTVVFESRLPVGSSAKRISGSFTSDRAMATRCCCPPESCAGVWSMRPSSPSIASSSFARSTSLARGARRPRWYSSGISTFCSALVRASRLKLWNTHPMRAARRSARSSDVSRETSRPSNR